MNDNCVDAYIDYLDSDGDTYQTGPVRLPRHFPDGERCEWPCHGNRIVQAAVSIPSRNEQYVLTPFGENYATEFIRELYRRNY